MLFAQRLLLARQRACTLLSSYAPNKLQLPSWGPSMTCNLCTFSGMPDTRLCVQDGSHLFSINAASVGSFSMLFCWLCCVLSWILHTHERAHVFTYNNGLLGGQFQSLLQVY